MLFAALPPDESPHWLQRLGLIESPPDTVLRAAELSFRGILPLWAAAIILVVGAVLAYRLYFTETAKLSTLARFTLGTLRLALVALVVALLLRPVLLAEFGGVRPRPVAVLLDASKSMSLADRRVSPADKIRLAMAEGLLPATTAVNDNDALSRVEADKLADRPRIDLTRKLLSLPELDLLPRLGKVGPVQPFAFDRRLNTVTGSDWVASLKADGEQTALADAVQETLVRMTGELPAAMVVVTDGRDNASKSTLDEAARLCRDKGVPLHIVGVGSTEAGVLRFKDVIVPRTVFVDDKPDALDDEVVVPIRYQARGFKTGNVTFTVTLGDVTETKTVPVKQGDNLVEYVRIRPGKGKTGPRPVKVAMTIDSAKDAGDAIDKVTEVRNSRVKVLYVENTPRREYKFIHPVLDRDRRVLLRTYLAEGDPKLADSPADKESGSQYLAAFPENFPEPDGKDEDRRKFDLVILGDVPTKVLGDKGMKALRQFVKEGGGLVALAGRAYTPSDYAGSSLAEVFPVEFSQQDFGVEDLARAAPFKPVLTYEGEQSSVIALADKQEDNVRLWKEELWKDAPGFYWHYPVNDLRPGATALVVHPEKKVGREPDRKPMPLIASQYYGKGEVLFIGVDETWRWRDGTADRLTARFWGQIVARFGLPHLLGNASRTQVALERGEALLNAPGRVKVRVLDSQYEPLLRPTVKATVVNLDAKDDASKRREITLRKITGQPGEYEGSLPNDVTGRHEIRVAEADGLEGATLPYRVELPPRHELDDAGLPVEALTRLAAETGGRFYREENLSALPDAVEAKSASFSTRQEVLLWNPLAMAVFVLLVTAEWVIRKFSNLS